MRHKQSQKIQLVLDLAARQLQTAKENVTETQSRLKEERERLAGLRGYYSEYSQQFAACNIVIRAQDIANQRFFLSQLAGAIQQQETQIAGIEVHLDDALGVWRERHLKHQSLADLVEKLHLSEAAELETKTQKILDDWYSQTSSRKVKR